MSDQQDIWSTGHEDAAGSIISEEDMLAYLEGGLSPDHRRAIEYILSTEGLESDAFDGLQSLNSIEIQALKKQLHQTLNTHLNKRRRTRRGLAEQRWAWLAIGIILLLAMACYAVIYFIKHP